MKANDTTIFKRKWEKRDVGGEYKKENILFNRINQNIPHKTEKSRNSVSTYNYEVMEAKI